MNGSHRVPQWIATVATVTCVGLAALGLIAVVVGTALYDSRVLTFPVVVQVVVMAVGICLGAVPCTILLRAAGLAWMGDLTGARSASIAGGLVLLPGIGVAAFFRMFANPCWNNPTCTSDPSLEDGILKIGILVLMPAAAVALLITPILLGLARKSIRQSSH